jgi:hypothetical protein
MLIPRKNANKVADHISAALHRSKKKESDVVKADLPDDIREITVSKRSNDRNRLKLVGIANCARIDAARAFEFYKQMHDIKLIVVESATMKNLKTIIKKIPAGKLCISLPPVFYEREIKNIRNLIDACAQAGVRVEVNSYSGWILAKEKGATIYGGPWFSVLNGVAADALGGMGFESVYASIEADRKQLEDLCPSCPLPMSIMIYGRPILMMTRADVPWALKDGDTIEDSRNIRITTNHQWGLNTFRPEDAFNLTGIRNQKIYARYMVADLVSAKEPVNEWYSLGERHKKDFAFNYGRTLY